MCQDLKELPRVGIDYSDQRSTLAPENVLGALGRKKKKWVRNAQIFAIFYFIEISAIMPFTRQFPHNKRGLSASIPGNEVSLKLFFIASLQPP